MSHEKPYENKDWLYSGQPILKPIVEEPSRKKDENIAVPTEVEAIHQQLKVAKEKYLNGELTKHDVELIASHAKAALPHSHGKDKVEMEGLPKTWEELFRLQEMEKRKSKKKK